MHPFGQTTPHTQRSVIRAAWWAPAICVCCPAQNERKRFASLQQKLTKTTYNTYMFYDMYNISQYHTNTNINMKQFDCLYMQDPASVKLQA